eukprot:gene3016-5800_t
MSQDDMLDESFHTSSSITKNEAETSAAVEVDNHGIDPPPFQEDCKQDSLRSTSDRELSSENILELEANSSTKISNVENTNDSLSSHSETSRRNTLEDNQKEQNEKDRQDLSHLFDEDQNSLMKSGGSAENPYSPEHGSSNSLGEGEGEGEGEEEEGEGEEEEYEENDEGDGKGKEVPQSTREMLLAEQNLSDFADHMAADEDQSQRSIPRPRISTPCHIKFSDQKVYLAKLPNFISIEQRPFDANNFAEEESQLVDDLGRRRIKLAFITINGNDHLFYSKVSLFAKNNFPNFGLNLPSELCLIVEQLENTIRWRINNGRLQSNARLVKWDDGSMSLVLGDEVHDCTATDLTKSGATRQLLVKKEDGLGYEARQSFAQQLTFKASNLSGRTQQRLMQKAWSQARAANRTRATVVIENPEDLKRRALKEEQEAVRQKVRQQQKRSKRQQLTPLDIEPDAQETSINYYKNKISKDEDLYGDSESDMDDFIVGDQLACFGKCFHFFHVVFNTDQDDSEVTQTKTLQSRRISSDDDD